MEVMHEGKELVFLYQLIDGSTCSSFACHVARSAGLPEAIIVRGRQASFPPLWSMVTKKLYVDIAEYTSTLITHLNKNNVKSKVPYSECGISASEVIP